MTGLSTKQRKMQEKGEAVVAFITAFWAARGYAPTIREIQDACRFSSGSVVVYHLQLLQGKGKVQREPGLARTLRVV